MSETAIGPPTPLARRFVRMVLGFGVGVGVGLAPFLGKVEVPGFQALLTLYPHGLRDALITLGAFVMGLVALAVQFYVDEEISLAALRQRFRKGLWALGAGIAAVVVLWVLFAVRIETTGEAFSALVAGERLPSCNCEGLSDAQCIQVLTSDPVALGTCWGDRTYKLVTLAFFASYLLLTGGFGGLIGLLLLQERARRRKSRPKSRRKSGGAPPG